MKGLKIQIRVDGYEWNETSGMYIGPPSMGIDRLISNEELNYRGGRIAPKDVFRVEMNLLVDKLIKELFGDE